MNKSQNVESQLTGEQRALVLRFVLVFSRFEYALKRSGFIEGNKHEVKAAWDAFAQKYDEAFSSLRKDAVEDACKYFSAHAPRKQILENGKLTWSAPLEQKKSFLEFLLLAIRRVRNNLFHGGKFPLQPIAEPARNIVLLAHGLTILEACLWLDGNVAKQFKRTDW